MAVIIAESPEQAIPEDGLKQVSEWTVIYPTNLEMQSTGMVFKTCCNCSTLFPLANR
jgi:hypothetical protein